MTGRIFSIKKSTWLIVSLLINSFLYLGISIPFVVIYKDYNSIFFIFCLVTGFHQVFKSVLFKLDSSCFFGFVLFLVGFFYFYCLFFSLIWLYPSFLVLSFAIASLITGYFYKQSFHIFLALSLYFVGLGLLLFLFNLISLWIFLAILLSGVLLLVIRYFTL